MYLAVFFVVRTSIIIQVGFVFTLEVFTIVLGCLLEFVCYSSNCIFRNLS